MIRKLFCKYLLQIPTANIYCKYLLQIPTANTYCKYLLQIPTANTYCKIPTAQIVTPAVHRILDFWQTLV